MKTDFDFNGQYYMRHPLPVDKYLSAETVADFHFQGQPFGFYVERLVGHWFNVEVIRGQQEIDCWANGKLCSIRTYGYGTGEIRFQRSVMIGGGGRCLDKDRHRAETRQLAGHIAIIRYDNNDSITHAFVGFIPKKHILDNDLDHMRLRSLYEYFKFSEEKFVKTISKYRNDGIHHIK